MIQEHLEEVESTQTYLLEHIDNYTADQDVLISCEYQTQGQGQYDRKWDSYDGSVCMSFTVTPNPVITLTSLEIGCLLHRFFNEIEKTNLKLKWPNDLLTHSGEKAGGILINNSNQEKLVVGVGLNLYLPLEHKQDYKTKAGGILKSKYEIKKSSYSQKVYEFILNNRMNEFEVENYWNAQCIHMNKKIIFIEEDKTYHAVFQGIGKHGEAILEHDRLITKHYSGSLLLRKN